MPCPESLRNQLRNKRSAPANRALESPRGASRNITAPRINLVHNILPTARPSTMTDTLALPCSTRESRLCASRSRHHPQDNAVHETLVKGKLIGWRVVSKRGAVRRAHLVHVPACRLRCGMKPYLRESQPRPNEGQAATSQAHRSVLCATRFAATATMTARHGNGNHTSVPGTILCTEDNTVLSLDGL